MVTWVRFLSSGLSVGDYDEIINDKMLMGNPSSRQKRGIHSHALRFLVIPEREHYIFLMLPDDKIVDFG